MVYSTSNSGLDVTRDEHADIFPSAGSTPPSSAPSRSYSHEAAEPERRRRSAIRIQAHARGRLARSDFLNRRWRLECELKAVRLQAAARGNLARSKLRESEGALQSSLDALLTSNVEHLDDEAEQWAATTQEREGASSWTARVKEAREYSRALQAKELVVRRALRKLERELQHLSVSAQKDAKRQQRQLQHEMAAITAELETVTRVTREAVQEQITLRSGARHHACADVERAVVRVQRLWRRKVGARASKLPVARAFIGAAGLLGLGGSSPAVPNPSATREY